MRDTAKPLGRLHAHQAHIEQGSLAVGDNVHLAVDAARRNRVYVAVSSLRVVSLGALLDGGTTGYRLDPATDCETR